jgi:flagellar basal body-associated protein FliL
MADEKAEAKVGEAPAGPKLILGMPMPQFAFVAANLLVMLGGVGYIAWASLIYQKPAITETQAVTEITKTVNTEAPAEGFFVENYSEMTITLRGQRGGKNRFVTVEVSLVCASEICQSQLQANKAKVEDAIQSTLANRSYTELGSLEVKFRVKHELMERVNSFLRDTAITDVLFTNFVVQ